MAAARTSASLSPRRSTIDCWTSAGGAFFTFRLKSAAARTAGAGDSRNEARSLGGRRPERARSGRARATRFARRFRVIEQ